ncbi:MAG: DUF5320 domain-containing protein [Patescibacteria group bacterium]|nr:DUF5320 domain-containing protein [Patescibacteria group bacterium]MDD4303994.1 DUF5320 domain-containing protein [Patescibacteria group bacterium]MDD4695017.1 DUF5320 domain-containing protein [Patescibacteria group bacterium]
MPKYDGTGPMGQGPMTGRGMGNCNSFRSGFPCRGLRFLNRQNPKNLEDYRDELKEELSYVENEIKDSK